jgi:23S rRNA (uracil1939-C5)-methyltransferase
MTLLTLDIEKPAAGGRMLARHQGQVVLVSGAIPGERVTARLGPREKGVAFAETVDVLSPSPDRRPVGSDPRCGGNVLAHIEYARQLTLKGEIIRDAFGRIGRYQLGETPVVVGSPERGYRMRARLHCRDGRIGFYLEGTHQLCDASATGQLLPSTANWIDTAREALSTHSLSGLAALELAENIHGDQRACHLELHAGVDPRRFTALAPGLVGLSAERADRPGVARLAGTPLISDTIRAGGDDACTLRLQRDVRVFFQGNRFLIERLVRHVVGLVQPGPVVDLYAGVGLFGLSLAALGRDAITVVEGEPVSATDLAANAAPLGDRVTVARSSVERFLTLAARPDHTRTSFIVDPPRTGLSKEAIAGVIELRPPQVVYVSCDVATLARDARLLLEAGYRLERLDGLDMFPNTAHVESIAVFTM